MSKQLRKFGIKINQKIDKMKKTIKGKNKYIQRNK